MLKRIALLAGLMLVMSPASAVWVSYTGTQIQPKSPSVWVAYTGFKLPWIKAN